jgi:hypothetical protein
VAQLKHHADPSLFKDTGSDPPQFEQGNLCSTKLLFSMNSPLKKRLGTSQGNA